MSEPKPMPSYWALAEEVTHLHGHLDKLQAENVRLRELCKELAEFLTEAEWLQWPELRAEMRELRIEVKP